MSENTFSDVAALIINCVLVIFLFLSLAERAVVTPTSLRVSFFFFFFYINGDWCWLLLPQLSRENTNYIIKNIDY